MWRKYLENVEEEMFFFACLFVCVPACVRVYIYMCVCVSQCVCACVRAGQCVCVWWTSGLHGKTESDRVVSGFQWRLADLLTVFSTPTNPFAYLQMLKKANFTSLNHTMLLLTFQSPSLDIAAWRSLWFYKPPSPNAHIQMPLLHFQKYRHFSKEKDSVLKQQWGMFISGYRCRKNLVSVASIPLLDYPLTFSPVHCCTLRQYSLLLLWRIQDLTA